MFVCVREGAGVEREEPPPPPAMSLFKYVMQNVPLVFDQNNLFLKEIHVGRVHKFSKNLGDT